MSNYGQRPPGPGQYQQTPYGAQQAYGQQPPAQSGPYGGYQGQPGQPAGQQPPAQSGPYGGYQGQPGQPAGQQPPPQQGQANPYAGYSAQWGAQPAGGANQYQQQQPPQQGYAGQQQYGAAQYGQQAQQYGGYGQQPPQGAQGARPPGAFGQPPQNMYGPPPGADPAMWNFFQAVDQDRSGQINAQELQQALAAGNQANFKSETCQLMIRLFDVDRSNTINFQEFVGLMGYIQQWRACFERFDADRSGSIDPKEFATALQSFSYRLSPPIVEALVKRFGAPGTGGTNVIRFDEFIVACVQLQRMTDSFRKYDTSKTGSIQLQYEQFIGLLLEASFV